MGPRSLAPVSPVKAASDLSACTSFGTMAWYWYLAEEFRMSASGVGAVDVAACSGRMDSHSSSATLSILCKDFAEKLLAHVAQAMGLSWVCAATDGWGLTATGSTALLP